MLIRRGGGVPRFLRPTTGAGGRAAAAVARNQALPPAPAATKWPLALVLAKARESRAAGRRWRLPEGALAPAQPPSASTKYVRAFPGADASISAGSQGRPPASGRDLCVPLRCILGGSKLPLLTAQCSFLTLQFYVEKADLGTGSSRRPCLRANGCWKAFLLSILGAHRRSSP